MSYLVILAGSVKDQGYKFKGVGVLTTNIADYEKLTGGVDSQQIVTTNVTKSGGSLWLAHEGTSPIPVVVSYVREGTVTRQVVLAQPGNVNTRVSLPDKMTRLTLSRANESTVPLGWSVQIAI